MKKRQYRLLRIKKNLQDKKNSGVPYVIWKLDNEQKEYIERWWETEPFLYSIKTRYFRNVNKLQSILLRDLHYECNRGKVTIVRTLSAEERKLLDEFGVHYRPFKFKIHLAS